MFLFATFSLSSAAQTRLVLNAGLTSSTAAGTGKDASASSGDALRSALGSPRAAVYDNQGNLFFVDSRNNQVLRLTPDAQLTIVAGTGREGDAGDGGPATAAFLNRPTSIVLRQDGTLLISDTGNHRIRSVSTSGVITTIAGTGVAGNRGDNGPATSAALRNPTALALLADNTLLIADTGNHRIRSLNAAGMITGIAGNGKEGDEGDGGAATNATFLRPAALLRLPDNRVLIADSAAHRIRALMPDGTITAFNTATLRRPQGIALDSAGNLLVADADLQQLLQIASNGYAVLAGNGHQGTAANGSLNSPSAVAVNGSGTIAISDTGNHQVQHVALPAMDFGAIPAGKQSTSQSLSLQNGGTSAIQITSITLPPAFVLAQGGTCSAFPVSLAPKATCSVKLAFSPSAQGPAKAIALVQPQTGPPATLLLTGTGTAPANLVASTTTLVSNGSISYVGGQVQLSASVAGSLQAAPTGTIAIQDGNNTLATVALVSGKASTATAALSLGQHQLRAAYSGDAAYASSTSATITQTVIAAPDFSMNVPASSYSGSASGSITLPVTVLPLNGTLNHSASIAIAGLPTGATATFLPSTFTLAGDPVAITLIIKLPATLSSNPVHAVRWLTVALLLPLLPFRRRTYPVLVAAIAMLSLQGCGGFRTTTTSTGGGSTPHRYACTLTATTTGVLNDTLTHSIPLELDVTQ